MRGPSRWAENPGDVSNAVNLIRSAQNRGEVPSPSSLRSSTSRRVRGEVQTPSFSRRDFAPELSQISAAKSLPRRMRELCALSSLRFAVARIERSEIRGLAPGFRFAQPGLRKKGSGTPTNADYFHSARSRNVLTKIRVSARDVFVPSVVKEYLCNPREYG